MRFDKIAIHGYRQYRDLELAFPKNGDHDVHIIIAKNGTGKTNLLNATNWCLYQKEPHLQSEENALPVCNQALIRDAADNGEDFVTVSVRIDATDGDTHYSFERKQDWLPVGKGRPRGNAVLTVRVLTVGSTDSEIYNGEGAKEIVEQYVPERIKDYFFFDGERLTNYFAKQNQSHIKDSINEIAQVNTLEQAEKHLKEIARAYEKEANKGNSRYADFTRQRDQLESEIKHAKEVRTKQEDDLKQAEVEIQAATDTINGCDSIVEDSHKYDQNEAKMKEVEKQLEQVASEISDFAIEYTTLLNCFRANTKANAFIREKYDAGELPPKIDKDLIQKSIESHTCAVCHQNMSDDVAKHVAELLDQIDMTNSQSATLVRVKNDIEDLVSQAKQYESKRNALMVKYNGLQDRYDQLQNENSGLAIRIKTVSNLKTIEEAMDRRSHFERIRDNALRQMGSQDNQIDSLGRDLDQLEKEIAKEEKKVAAQNLKQAYAKRSRQLWDYVSLTLRSIADTTRSQMQTETWETFSRLSTKTNTYGSVQVDDNYNVQLLDKNGTSCLGSASAGEAELLALAFTIALHNVSENNAMLFIDSPVGRISDEVRSNFTKVLVDLSKEKQLILTFTLSEYSEEVSSVFNSNGYSTKKELRLNSDETAVEVLDA